MIQRAECVLCQRPLTASDPGCARCGRPPLDPAALERAGALAREFARTHARDPWLRSAGLLSYSLRSRRRGFLDDPTRPFTRAALELLWSFASLGGEAGISPLAETAIHDGIESSHPVLARALAQLLDRHRERLLEPGARFEQWYAGL